MALHHSPKIVTDGLVLHLDSADTNSYPGSGSIWYDLSGNGHHIELGSSVSPVTYIANRVLQFSQDGNGYGRNSSMDLSNSDYTVISWVRKLSNGNDGRTITAYNNNWLLAHHDNTYGDYYAEGWVNDVPSPQSDTVWRMYTGTGAIGADSYSAYINNSLIITNSNGNQGPNGWNLNNQYGQYSSCQIATLTCYSRVLSLAEITQLYNSNKNRFGV